MKLIQMVAGYGSAIFQMVDMDLENIKVQFRQFIEFLGKFIAAPYLMELTFFISAMCALVSIQITYFLALKKKMLLMLLVRIGPLSL